MKPLESNLRSIRKKHKISRKASKDSNRQPRRKFRGISKIIISKVKNFKPLKRI